MLKSFKKNKSAKRVENAKKQKAIAIEKKLAARPVSPPSSDTESDSDSDSEYEEILISSINGKPQKKVHASHGQSKESHGQSKETVQKPEQPSTAQTEPNHSNHFQEEPTCEACVGDKNSQTIAPVELKKSAPIPKPSNTVRVKPKREKVVIKKYYQKRKVSNDVRTEPVASAPEPRRSYIGIGNRKSTQHASPHAAMSSRILNW